MSLIHTWTGDGTIKMEHGQDRSARQINHNVQKRGHFLKGNMFYGTPFPFLVDGQ